MKGTNLLRQDHKTIFRSFDVLQCIAEEKNLNEVHVTTLLRFLRVFADKHHQMKEESVLFPELMHGILFPILDVLMSSELDEKVSAGFEKLHWTSVYWTTSSVSGERSSARSIRSDWCHRTSKYAI